MPVSTGSDQDICAICLEDLRQPQIQSCGHAFCHHCVIDMINHQTTGKAIPCPICRRLMASTERRWILTTPKDQKDHIDKLANVIIGCMIFAMTIIGFILNYALTYLGNYWYSI